MPGKALLLALVASAAFGQTPTIEQQLASGLPRDVAWGAYLAAEKNRTDLIPELAAIIDSATVHSSEKSVPPETAMIEAVADALIRLHAQLPAQTVMHLYPALPAQTIILLANATENPDALMKIFLTTSQRDLWLAAGNLLAAQFPAHPVPGFAAALLNGTNITFHLDVVRADDRNIGEADAGCANDFLMAPDPAFADWPKAQMYRLVTDDSVSSNVFAPGGHPVRFGSWATTDYLDPWQDGDCSEAKSHYWRMGLIYQLPGVPLEISFPLEPLFSQRIVYTSDQAVQDSARAIIQIEEQTFRYLVNVLTKSGALSSTEAESLQFHCTLTATDKRPQPHGSLLLEGNGCSVADNQNRNF